MERKEREDDWALCPFQRSVFRLPLPSAHTHFQIIILWSVSQSSAMSELYRCEQNVGRGPKFHGFVQC
jgi:hypothetical protein